MSTHYTLRGGYSSLGTYCGVFCVRANTGADDYSWRIGAALLLLHIILFVVVVLALAPLVERFLFLRTMVLVIPTGSLALLYCASYYAFRGGLSDAGAYCGAFCVSARYSFSYAYWYYGAALSFKAYIIIYYIHGETT